jgi:hypothetical protein
MIGRLIFASVCLAVSLFAGEQIIDNPTDTITIKASRDSVNRIIFPSKILSKQYSKEKGLQVKSFGNEAFFKWIPMEEQVQQTVGGKTTTMPNESKVVYYKAKRAEVFFVTESGTYSVVFVPKKLDPQTIRINDGLAKTKSIVKYETQDPYKATLKKITKETFLGNIPYGYEEIKAQQRYSSDNLEVIRTRVLQGTLYKATHYKLFNKGETPVSLDERNYISLAKKPLFVSVFYEKQLKELSPMDEAELVIVEQGGMDD